jgi:hypothetical protein
MTDPKNGFLLKDLQERLPESRRALIEQLLDLPGVTQSVRIRGGPSPQLALHRIWWTKESSARDELLKAWLDARRGAAE